MTRFSAPLLAGLLTTCPAAGQAPVAPFPSRLPPGAGVSRPFVTPPVGFAGGFRTPANGFILPAYGGYYTAPSLFPYSNRFYPNYAVLPQGFVGGYGFGYGPGTVINVINNGPAAGGAAPGQPSGGRRQDIPVSGEETATLTVALPSAGDVWFDGVKQNESGATYTLTSTALKPGEQHTFDVRAEWLVDGKRVRADRKMTVSAGDRQKLTLVLGDPVE